MKGHDWKDAVRRHARRSGAGDLPLHTIDELAAHLEDVYLDALRRGGAEADARARAEAVLTESSLTPVPRSRTRIPESQPAPGGRGFSGAVGDLRFAWRQLRRRPSFAAVAIATLGLGAGAATAIFSIVDTVLLRPLPYRHPEQLLAIWETNAEKGLPKERISPVNFMDYRQLDMVFEDAAAWWRPELSLSQPGTEPLRVSTIETSANLFQLLGVSPQLGPGFPANGPFFSREPIAVVSDRLWRQRYGADPSIVGRLLDAKDGHYTIAGVMPPGFNFPDDVDVWLRLNWDLSQHSRQAHFMESVVRLKPGATVDQAGRELGALSGRLAAAAPSSNRGWVARAVPLLDDMLGFYRPALFVLTGAVAILLLTACLNVASLLLARATTRAREMAVRAALGASRGRLIRQMLVESLLLAALGTAAGAVAALALLKGAIATLPASVPRLAETTIDLRLLAFSLAVVTATALLFGLIPAILLSRTRASETLKDGSRGSTGLRGRRWNQAVVVTEVALACAVLLASALLVRSVDRMIHAPAGVVNDGVIMATLQLPTAGYPDWNKVDQMYAGLLDAMRQQPGIAAAGATTALPLDAGWRLAYVVEGRPPAAPGEQSVAQHLSVTSGYFETVRARLLAGRLFAGADTMRSDPVVVVNESFARQVFPGENAVDRRLISTVRNIGPLGLNVVGRGPFTIVGVIADIRQEPLDQRQEPAVYHVSRQFPFRGMTLVARGNDASTVIAGMRAAVRGLDPSLPLSNVRSLDERLRLRTAAPRLLMTVLVTFAALTGALAAIGVYGLLAWMVNDRRRELAIRMALGAQPASLARLVTMQGLVLAGSGIAIGLAVAQFGRSLLRAVLFETRTTDAAAIAITVGLLLLAAGAACLGPAIRAARLAPVDGLRTD